MTDGLRAMEHVRLAQREHVAVVTLVDHERRNAMTATMVAEIVETFDALEADGSVGAVVITGEPPAFCSGADVAALGSLSDEQTEGGRRSITSIYEGFLRVLRSTLPTVAAVNGPAVGAGMNLALACHVRIAGESARFDTRFLRIGLHPGGGHAWMLERAVGPQAAAAMMLFGERLDGARATEVGLAWACHPDAELVDRAGDFAAGAAAIPKELSAAAGATLREAPWHADFDAAVATEVTRQAWSLGQGWFRPR
jgi:enoyl-CoA hydratase